MRSNATACTSKKHERSLTNPALVTVRLRLAFAPLLVLSGGLAAATNSVTACSTVITAPGTWILENNLSCTGDAIDIQSNHVTLKLNGFAITGPGSSNGSANGVLVASSGGTSLKDVTILGPGTITMFPSGITFTGTNGGGAVDVSLLSNAQGIAFTSDALGAAPASLVISQNNLQKNDNGIDASSLSSSTIAGNVCTGNVDGINLAAGTGNKLVGNTCDNNTHAGISLGGLAGSSCAGNTLEGNHTANNTFYGIALYVNTSMNHLIGNVSLGSAFADILDENSNCGTNTYRSDVFQNASQSCIK